VLVIIDAKPKDLGLPTDAYISVDEVHDDGTPTTRTFDHVRSEIGAEEAEEVGVEHLLRDIKDTTVGSLSQHLSTLVAALKSLFSKLDDISVYLEQVTDGTLPVNHPIIYQLQDVFNLLPNLNIPQLMDAFTVKTNDQNLVMYTASIIRAVIALHSLINNKTSNRAAEKDGVKKIEVEKEDKEEKEKDTSKEDSNKKDVKST